MKIIGVGPASLVNGDIDIVPPAGQIEPVEMERDLSQTQDRCSGAVLVP